MKRKAGEGAWQVGKKKETRKKRVPVRTKGDGEEEGLWTKKRPVGWTGLTCEGPTLHGTTR